ncbi:unnamed protein product [Ostreobium quekettii]|uniref:Protein S-acyltransferase n=1 Tax=Ostreobium quekettii TaxID=121088 RepID=A0A8S1IKY7_9CHLO|nr:unnamed protein product [Ostreobium quekettii]
MQVTLLILTFVLAIALASLMGWHIHLVISNKTTIEYHEGVTAKLKASKMGRSWEHPYDVGLAGNLVDMFGDGLFQWLQIRAGLRGTGTSFLTILDDKQRT